jgi:hypothetical protein
LEEKLCDFACLISYSSEATGSSRFRLLIESRLHSKRFDVSNDPALDCFDNSTGSSLSSSVLMAKDRHSRMPRQASKVSLVEVAKNPAQSIATQPVPSIHLDVTQVDPDSGKRSRTDFRHRRQTVPRALIAYPPGAGSDSMNPRMKRGTKHCLLFRNPKHKSGELFP